MSDSKKNAPKRRFEEFSNANDWEQRKLAETKTFFTDGNYGKSYPSSSDITNQENGVPFLRGSDFHKGYLDASNANYITFEKHAKLTSGHIKQDDIVLVVRGSLGTLGYAKAENIGWNINSQLAILRTDKDELDGKYLIQYLLSTCGQKEILSRNTGTALKQLPIKQLKDISIPFTLIEEQKQIGAFFMQLDSTIALHQRKLEKIKALKTAYLSEMFPAEGELKPKRRFAGFTDDWEQRNLMSVFEFPVSTNSLSRSQLNYDNGEIKSVHYGDILVNYDSILEIAKDRIPFITNGVIDKYKPNLLENGDLIFADAAEDETVGKAVEVGGKTNEYIVAGLHTIVARPRRKMAKFFWGYYINSSIYHNQLLRLMQGTKVASISKSNLQKTYVTYPDNFVEQQKIGAFFKQLDNTIALHQRKLKKLQNIKKAYLNEMFI